MAERKLNRLSGAQLIELSRYLDKHDDEFFSAGLSCAEVTERASSDLGYEVSASTIVRFRNAGGYKFGQFRTKRDKDADNADLVELRELVHTLAHRVISLEARLVATGA